MVTCNSCRSAILNLVVVVVLMVVAVVVVEMVVLTPPIQPILQTDKSSYLTFQKCGRSGIGWVVMMVLVMVRY